MTKLYAHVDYTWHLVVLRVIVMSPLVLLKSITDFISNVNEKLYWKLDEMLPVCYRETKVPFDQLSKGEKRAIQRITKARGVILSQVES